MSKVLLPPNEAILDVCNSLETAIGQFLAATSSLPEGTFGYFESLDEAYLQIAHIIRHIESMIELARTDLILLPSAAVLARAVMEIGASGIWLLTPPDPFEREARWLARLGKEIEYHRKIGNRLTELGQDASSTWATRNLVQEFRDDVKSVFPVGYKVDAPVPKFDALLREIGVPSHYLEYSLLSQFIHGTHVANGLYRRNFGIDKQFGEFVTAQQWERPLRIVWFYFYKLCTLFINRCGGQANEVFAPLLVTTIEHTWPKIGA